MNLQDRGCSSACIFQVGSEPAGRTERHRPRPAQAGEQQTIRVTKRLLADNTAHDAIRKFDASLSSWYRANTVPFDDNDARLLPTTEYDRFTSHMRNSRT